MSSLTIGVCELLLICLKKYLISAKFHMRNPSNDCISSQETPRLRNKATMITASSLVCVRTHVEPFPKWDIKSSAKG